VRVSVRDRPSDELLAASTVIRLKVSANGIVASDAGTPALGQPSAGQTPAPQQPQ